MVKAFTVSRLDLHSTKNVHGYQLLQTFIIFTCKYSPKILCGCKAIHKKCESFSPWINKQYTVCRGHCGLDIVVTALLLCIPADMEFPQDLFQIIKKIYRYYFHILAHLYHNHFHEYLNLGVHDCLNTLFLHFVYFVQEFQLLESRELSPLEDFIQKLISVDKDLQKHPPKEDEDVEPMICSKLKN